MADLQTVFDYLMYLKGQVDQVVNSLATGGDTTAAAILQDIKDTVHAIQQKVVEIDSKIGTAQTNNQQGGGQGGTQAGPGA